MPDARVGTSAHHRRSLLAAVALAAIAGDAERLEIIHVIRAAEAEGHDVIHFQHYSRGLADAALVQVALEDEKAGAVRQPGAARGWNSVFRKFTGE